MPSPTEVSQAVDGVNWFSTVGSGDILTTSSSPLNSEQPLNRLTESSPGRSNLRNCIGSLSDGQIIDFHLHHFAQCRGGFAVYACFPCTTRTLFITFTQQRFTTQIGNNRCPPFSLYGVQSFQRSVRLLKLYLNTRKTQCNHSFQV